MVIFELSFKHLLPKKGLSRNKFLKPKQETLILELRMEIIITLLNTEQKKEILCKMMTFFLVFEFRPNQIKLV